MFTRLTSALILLLAACSQSDSAQQDLQSLSSSTATVEMILSAYLDHSVPGKFAKRALEDSQRQQTTLLSDLEKSANEGSAKAGGEAARSVVQLTSQAQAAVAHSERHAARHALEQLKEPAQRLRDLLSPIRRQRNEKAFRDLAGNRH